MTILSSPQVRPSLRQLSAAARAIAAAQCALCGFDVLEPASRERTSCDLCAANAGGILRLIVHGGHGGIWDLVEPYLDRGNRVSATKADRYRAIDQWLADHNPKVAFCLVLFDSAAPSLPPRIFVATASEIASELHHSVARMRDLKFYEFGEFTDSEWSEMFERIPSAWRFSQARIEQLMDAPAGRAPLIIRFSSASKCAACAAVQPASCLRCLPMMN